MFKKIKPQGVSETGTHACKIAQFPHCDQRILHAPGECQVCDEHKEWQDLRIAWGVAFTGWSPDEKELPCPADYARGDAHKKWHGNQANPWKPSDRYPGYEERINESGHRETRSIGNSGN